MAFIMKKEEIGLFCVIVFLTCCVTMVTAGEALIPPPFVCPKMDSYGCRYYTHVTNKEHYCAQGWVKKNCRAACGDCVKPECTVEDNVQCARYKENVRYYCDGHWVTMNCRAMCGYCSNPEPVFSPPMGDSVAAAMPVGSPEHGAWTQWTPFTPCSKTCGNGWQYRRRECSAPTPKFGGKDCDGKDMERKYCKLGECHVEPVLSPPGDGSVASAPMRPGASIKPWVLITRGWGRGRSVDEKTCHGIKKVGGRRVDWVEPINDRKYPSGCYIKVNKVNVLHQGEAIKVHGKYLKRKVFNSFYNRAASTAKCTRIRRCVVKNPALKGAP